MLWLLTPRVLQHMYCIWVAWTPFDTSFDALCSLAAAGGPQAPRPAQGRQRLPPPQEPLPGDPLLRRPRPASAAGRRGVGRIPAAPGRGTGGGSWGCGSVHLRPHGGGGQRGSAAGAAARRWRGAVVVLDGRGCAHACRCRRCMLTAFYSPAALCGMGTGPPRGCRYYH
jgi:hypothetical protein